MITKKGDDDEKKMECDFNIYHVRRSDFHRSSACK
jgi:hypothetical protein